MSDIIISKKNEVYARIICEDGLAMELSEYFTFFVPGYKFQPLYKNKIWDGKIRLFNRSTHLIYLGLISYVEEFCVERKYTLSYDDTRPDIEDEYSRYHATKFIDSLDIHSRGVKLIPGEHQIDAYQHAMQRRRALLVSPTASGKSYIIYLLFRQLLQYQGLKGLVIVPTTTLVEQLTSDFKDYSSTNGFDVESNVNKIYDFDGVTHESDKPLFISTWQSLFKKPPEYFDQFQYVIGDEAHEFQAKSLVGIMTQCLNTKYRIGLTGTLDGTKTHKLVLEGLFGTHRKIISTKELQDQGLISRLEIKCLVLKHPPEICKFVSEKENRSFETELSYLIDYAPRNKFIKNLAVSMEKNTLVLFQRVADHGQILYDMIRNTEKLGDRKVFFIHGEVDTSERESVRKIMETEKNAIVVASYGTFQRGIDIRNLFNVILASPAKSRIRNLQSIGRSLRLSAGKDMATLYDISDDLIHESRMNHTMKHFLERVSIYNEEQFPFKIYKIGLKNG